MARKKRSNTEKQITSGNDEAIQSKTDRSQKVMNTIINTSIILMITVMGGFTQAMMETIDTMTSEIAGAIGEEEAEQKVNKESKQKLPEIGEEMKAMISDVRKDVYAQLKQKRKEIEPFLSDAAFDLGPKIIDGYDFKLPKLTEELDDSSLAQYSHLLVGEDPSFTEMFKELTNWMNNLPKSPERSEKSKALH